MQPQKHYFDRKVMSDRKCYRTTNKEENQLRQGAVYAKMPSK